MSSRRSASGSSGGRGKPWQTVFNPALGPDAYKVDNLEAFILTAGRDEFDAYKDELERATNAALLDARRRAGLPDVAVTAEDKTRAAAINQATARTGAYRQMSQNLRWGVVTRLHQAGRIQPLAAPAAGVAAGRPGRTTEINMDAVTGRWTTLMAEMNVGEDDAGLKKAFVDWVASTGPEGYKTNALEQAARLLKARGFSTIKGTGDSKKYALYNLVMRSVGHAERATPAGVPVAAVAARAVVTVPSGNIEALRRELRRRGITNAGQLQAQLRNELVMIAKIGGLKASGLKADLVNSIAAAVSFQELMLPAAAEAKIKELTVLAITDRDSAIAQARALGADVLGNVSLATMRDFARAASLDIPRTTSRENIIHKLTGQRSAVSERAQRREEILRGGEAACENASMAEIQAIARDLGLEVVGLSKARLCAGIRAHEGARQAQAILSNLPTIERLSREPDNQARVDQWTTFLGRHSLPVTWNLDNIPSQWFDVHYKSRAARLYPATGRRLWDAWQAAEWPEDREGIEALAEIFSDVVPSFRDLSRLGTDQIQAELANVQNWWRSLSRNDPEAYRALQSKASRILGQEFNGTPSPLVAPSSPRRPPSPRPSPRPVAGTSSVGQDPFAFDVTGGASDLRGSTTRQYAEVARDVSNLLDFGPPRVQGTRSRTPSPAPSPVTEGFSDF